MFVFEALSKALSSLTVATILRVTAIIAALNRTRYAAKDIAGKTGTANTEKRTKNNN